MRTVWTSAFMLDTVLSGIILTDTFVTGLICQEYLSLAVFNAICYPLQNIPVSRIVKLRYLEQDVSFLIGLH